ncbi:MAG TPA: phosphatidylserine decarboxylase [Phycisphaerae bacterium]|nr:phosphatidylserine decarboxylase [Phycisphaerae bacterium]HNU44696.1 phosphatidylserine decarboxylase [Phycisphaerae bacterium]
MLWVAKEGRYEVLTATVVLGALAVAASMWFWPAALLPAVVWLAVFWFFRDPKRETSVAVGELCSPADGTVTDVTPLDRHEDIGGPAVRVGIFMSLVSVHANRAPCPGRVRTVAHRPGVFLNARSADAGGRNESNALLLDPDPPLPGPIEVRQVAGVLARRIVCHVAPGDVVAAGYRIGFIKFGSRAELVIPRLPGTEVLVKAGDPVFGGLTVLARQPVAK